VPGGAPRSAALNTEPANDQPAVLLAEGEPGLRSLIAAALGAAGFAVSVAETGALAVGLARERAFKVIIVSSGLDGTITKLRRERRGVPLVALLDTDQVQHRQKSFYAGAGAVFSRRSLDVPALVAAVRELANERPVTALAAGAEPVIIGSSAALASVRFLAERFARTDEPVIILGETGTGKELFGQLIHARSGRPGRYVTINCAAMPGELLESELFGHAKGAFTGAYAEKAGLLEEAHHGTVLLDEITEMPRPLQKKLLRFLQDHKLRRVGALTEREVDVRILSASNRENVLGDTAERCPYRIGGCIGLAPDVFYRLGNLLLVIPPLRARRSDIPELAQHIVQRKRAGAPLTISEAVLKQLTAADWPGNVRELEGVLAHALSMCDGDTLLPEHLPGPAVIPDPRAAAGGDPQTQTPPAHS
jgi:DNA-binding NtrC family response regulator